MAKQTEKIFFSKKKKKILKRYFSVDFLIKNFTHTELERIYCTVSKARIKAATPTNLFKNSPKSNLLTKMPAFERIDGWQPLHLLNNESFSRD